VSINAYFLKIDCEFDIKKVIFINVAF